MLSFPPPTVILNRRRRISVRAAVEKIGNKYRSAGRLPIGSPGSGECLFGLQSSAPLCHFVALFPSRGRKTLPAYLPAFIVILSDSEESQYVPKMTAASALGKR